MGIKEALNNLRQSGPEFAAMSDVQILDVAYDRSGAAEAGVTREDFHRRAGLQNRPTASAPHQMPAIPAQGPGAMMAETLGQAPQRMRPKGRPDGLGQSPAQAILEAAKPRPTESARGDLAAGMLQARQIPHGMRAAAGARQAQAGMHNQAMTHAATGEIASLQARMAQLEAERSQLTGRNRNPERMAAIDAEMNSLMQRNRQLRLAVQDDSHAQERIQRSTAQQVGGLAQISQAGQQLQELQGQIDQIPLNEAARQIGQAETFGEGWQAFKGDPLGAMRAFTLRSLPSSVPTIGAAVAGSIVGSPAAGAMAAGGVGAAVEYGSSVAQEVDQAFRENRVDPSDPDAITAMLEANPGLFSEIAQKARARAAIIGGADAVSGGVGGQIAKAAAGTGRASRAGVAAASGAVIEPAMEGAGEALAGYATEGEVSPGEVMAEMIGGAGQGAVQTTGQVAAELRRATPQGKSPGGLPVAQNPSDSVEPFAPPQEADTAPGDNAPEIGTSDVQNHAQDAENTPEQADITLDNLATEDDAQKRAMLDGMDVIDDQDGNPLWIMRDDAGEITSFEPVRPGETSHPQKSGTLSTQKAAQATEVPSKQADTSTDKKPDTSKPEPAPEERLAEMGIKPPSKDLPKRPFTHAMKQRDFGTAENSRTKIDPNGSAGQRLKAAGITPENTPGIFKNGGAQELDTVPVSEMRAQHPDAPDDGSGQYVDPQWITDRIADEFAGKPHYSADQQDLVQEHQDYEQAYESFERSMFTDEGDMTAPVSAKERRRRKAERDLLIMVAMDDGMYLDDDQADAIIDDQDAEEAAYADLSVMEPEGYTDERTDAPEGYTPLDAVRLQERSRKEKSDGHDAEIQKGVRAGGEDLTRSEGDRPRPGTGKGAHAQHEQAKRRPDKEAQPKHERTDAGDQQLIPGVAPVTDKDRAQAAMDEPLQGGDAPMQAGRGDLFGDPAGRGDLFDQENSGIGNQPKGQENKGDQAGKAPEGDQQNQEPIKKKPTAGGRVNSLLNDAEKAELDALFGELDQIIPPGQFNSGVDPRALAVATKIVAVYVKAGVRNFKDILHGAIERTGWDTKRLAPSLMAAYNYERDAMELRDEDVSGMDDGGLVKIVKEVERELRNSGNDLEQGGEPGDRVGTQDVPNDGSGETGRAASGGEASERGLGGRGGVSDAGTPAARADRPATSGGSGAASGAGAAGTADPAGSDARSLPEQSDNHGRPDVEAASSAQSGSARKSDPDAQKRANQRDVKPNWGDADSIDEMLPALHSGQRDDVRKIEERFFAPQEGRKKGFGYMNTNGTGTGKTWSAAGLIKRFHAAGKTNALVMTKADTFKTFKEALEALGVPYSVPENTQTIHEGVNLITINGALGLNKEAAKIDWDLIIPDENNYISENMEGEIRKRGNDFRGLALHPDYIYLRADMLLHEEIEELNSLQARRTELAEHKQFDAAERLEAQIKKKGETVRAKREALIQKYRAKPRPHVAFFSATPFASAKSLEYAEGFLFDYEKLDSSGYNQPDGRQKFLIQNFGYRMKQNLLNEPDSNVDQSMMARRLNERLRAEGVMDGRVLDVDFDYQRMWADVDGGVGHQIDAAFKAMWEDKDYRPLYEAFNKSFKHHKRIQLLEAIKAQSAIALIQKDLDLGRKVVVFHDRQQGGGFNPFDVLEASGAHSNPDEISELWSRFKSEHPWVMDLSFEHLKPARDAILDAFPQAGIVGSGVSKKKSDQNKAAFNTDGGEMNVVIAQSESGKDGWSGHDETGKHQRAIHNLGIPNRPTTLIQIEGRIYRTGQASDAIFRYYNTGTNMEKRMFADTISGRADMAESLAMGDQARGLRKSIITGFQASHTITPSAGEGKGGKAFDIETRTADPFDEAKALYFAQQKGRQNNRGADYFATPEPLGLKMVEWADMNAAERALEPSAGHGAIARFFPEHVHQTAIEPSYDLQGDLAINAPDLNRRVDTSFEELDVSNKYHSVVMNPPFGKGGKLAMEHLKKAAMHLYDGGRVVALIPRGPMADKYLAQAKQVMEEKSVYQVAEVNLPDVTFKGAGTSVSTRVVIFDKAMTDDGRRYVRSLNSGPVDIKAKSVDELFDKLRDMPSVVDPRFIPAEPDVAEVEIPQQSDDPIVAKLEDQPIVRPVKFDRNREAHKERVDLAKDFGGDYVTKKRDSENWGFVFANEADANSFERAVNGMARKAGTMKEAFRDENPRFLEELRARLDALGLEDVRLAELESGPRDDLGRFRSRGKTMEILVRNAFSPMDTLNHESIHALRSLGLFTDQEWAALEAKAPQWIEGYGIAERYPNADQETLIEEAIAEAFADWARRNGAGAGLIRRSLEKIRRFFAGMVNAMAGTGFHEASTVFHGVDSGQIGRRERTGASRVADMARATTGPYAEASPSMWRALVDVFKSGPAAYAETGRLLRNVFRDWKHVEKDLNKQDGVNIKGDQSAFTQMELMESRAGAAIDEFEVEFQQPIARLMGEAQLSMKAVGAYLMDRHADERDKRIAQRFGRTNGSGLTKEDRQAIREELGKASVEQLKALSEIGLLVDQMHQSMIDLRVESGLLSKAEAAEWRKYKHYVPLKGFEEVDGATISEQLAGIKHNNNKGMNVKGRESMKAEGREQVGAASMEDIVPYAMAGAMEAIVRSHKNSVGQAFHQMVKDHPSPLWSIIEKKAKPIINTHTGMIQWVRNYDNKDLTDPAVISLKVDGETILIRLNDAKLVRAYGQMGMNQLGTAMNVMRAFTQWRSSANTRWNPGFLVVNPSRDAYSAMVFMQKFDPKKDPRFKGVRSSIAKRYFSSMRYLAQDATGMNKNDEWAGWIKEFRKEGGATAFAKYEDLSVKRKGIQKHAAHHSKGVVGRFAANSLTSYFRVMEAASDVTENAIRLATYRAFREAGFDKSEAAIAAKDITVNFNRRGELTPQIASFSMFFNAAVQGSAYLAENARYLIKPLAATFLLGVAEQILNAAGEEEEEWRNLEEWKKHRNLILPNVFSADGKDFIKIPFPYGFSSFKNLGRTSAAFFMGEIDGGEMARDIFKEAGTSWSPTGSALGTIIPDAVEPFFENAVNESNFTGNPIYYVRPGNKAPKSHSETGNPYWISPSIAKSLNGATFGSASKPGWIDLHPGQVDHIIRSFLGGMGKSAATLGKAVDKINSGIPLDGSDRIMAPVFSEKWGDRHDINLAHRNMNRISGTVEQTLAHFSNYGMQNARDPRFRGSDRIDSIARRLARDAIKDAGNRSFVGARQADLLRGLGGKRQVEELIAKAIAAGVKQRIKGDTPYANIFDYAVKKNAPIRQYIKQSSGFSKDGRVNRRDAKNSREYYLKAQQIQRDKGQWARELNAKIGDR